MALWDVLEVDPLGGRVVNRAEPRRGV